MLKRRSVSDNLEDGKLSAERLLKRGHDTEGCQDDANYQVRRNPWATVALGFCAGAIAGALFGLPVPRGGKKLDAESRRTAKEA
jgi:hypothetical protein